MISLGFRRFWISVGHPKGDRLERNPRSLTGRLTVSEGGLEPVERPLGKRVSDILSAKWIQEGFGCTPLFRIGALQERTKPRLILITAQRVSPGCLTHDRRLVAA